MAERGLTIAFMCSGHLPTSPSPEWLALLPSHLLHGAPLLHHSHTLTREGGFSPQPSHSYRGSAHWFSPLLVKGPRLPSQGLFPGALGSLGPLFSAAEFTTFSFQPAHGCSIQRRLSPLCAASTSVCIEKSERRACLHLC